MKAKSKPSLNASDLRLIREIVRTEFAQPLADYRKRVNKAEKALQRAQGENGELRAVARIQIQTIKESAKQDEPTLKQAFLAGRENFGDGHTFKSFEHWYKLTQMDAS